MTIKDDIQTETTKTLAEVWVEEQAYIVPDLKDLRLNANHAKKIDAAVLYADLSGSTAMVDSMPWQFSAEMYKIYLRGASRLINDGGGSITAYDGDRVMAIFTGNNKETDAVRVAMKINGVVERLLRPAIAKQYAATQFRLSHVIGIDASELRAARIGVRGDSDIVWVGRAANHAAKLSSISSAPIWITKPVYDKLGQDLLVYIANGVRNSCWIQNTWNGFNRSTIYSTTCLIPI